MNTLIKLVKLESNTETKKHLPILPSNWIIEIEEKWKSREWKVFDNKHFDICNMVCNNVYSASKYWEDQKTHYIFFNELTKEQRVYFSLINFESQVNNGGVYQFLFNYPELSVIVLQAMEIVELPKLAKDYKLVLNEYFGKFNTIDELFSKFQNSNDNWKERWNSFSNGYLELTSSKIIEDYFFDENFIKSYQEKLIKYVSENQDKLLVLKYD